MSIQYSIQFSLRDFHTGLIFVAASLTEIGKWNIRHYLSILQSVNNTLHCGAVSVSVIIRNSQCQHISFNFLCFVWRFVWPAPPGGGRGSERQLVGGWLFLLPALWLICGGGDASVIAVLDLGAAVVDSPHLESNMPTLLPAQSWHLSLTHRSAIKYSHNTDKELISSHDDLVSFISQW